jgi:hypothetical protein
MKLKGRIFLSINTEVLTSVLPGPPQLSSGYFTIISLARLALYPLTHFPVSPRLRFSPSPGP